VKFLVVFFMILKVKRWMAMTNNITIENIPVFRSTFHSLVDHDGYLINHENLTCREITEKSLLILRTSSDSKKNNKSVKEIFNIKLPDSPCESTGKNDAKCFWVSPDEYWLLNNRQFKVDLIDMIQLLPEGMTITDSSGAYGILEFDGFKTDLLSRWMSYDFKTLKDGRCVSTTFGQAPIFIYRDDQKIFMMVRHSFSHYVVGLLKDSAKRV